MIASSFFDLLAPSYAAQARKEASARPRTLAGRCNGRRLAPFGACVHFCWGAADLATQHARWVAAPPFHSCGFYVSAQAIALFQSPKAVVNSNPAIAASSPPPPALRTPAPSRRRSRPPRPTCPRGMALLCLMHSWTMTTPRFLCGYLAMHLDKSSNTQPQTLRVTPKVHI